MCHRQKLEYGFCRALAQPLCTPALRFRMAQKAAAPCLRFRPEVSGHHLFPTPLHPQTQRLDSEAKGVWFMLVSFSARSGQVLGCSFLASRLQHPQPALLHLPPLALSPPSIQLSLPGLLTLLRICQCFLFTQQRTRAVVAWPCLSHVLCSPALSPCSAGCPVPACVSVSFSFCAIFPQVM